eukprot:3647545-Prorocentrum_lima.AAC.1
MESILNRLIVIAKKIEDCTNVPGIKHRIMQPWNNGGLVSCCLKLNIKAHKPQGQQTTRIIHAAPKFALS